MATSIGRLMGEHEVGLFDAVLMDCEGAEEQILMSLDRIISRQICVEFHAHLGQCQGAADRLAGHLGRVGYSEAVQWMGRKGVEYRLFIANPTKIATA